MYYLIKKFAPNDNPHVSTDIFTFQTESELQEAVAESVALGYREVDLSVIGQAFCTGWYPEKQYAIIKGDTLKTADVMPRWFGMVEEAIKVAKGSTYKQELLEVYQTVAEMYPLKDGTCVFCCVNLPHGNFILGHDEDCKWRLANERLLEWKEEI